ncbi:hypothetical protein NEUTE1DRAFT_88327 [Neurospora tetrasperma FGSC 2508]|uniref:Uncharacterized protein n=1 Tax=Neurospora tetrasperma (strain FGSC 2508 / ATCC MYA-4615 / P0657) TaxID=510951 RepID=F8MVC7_NEUT8|nr:uncharacterized protein NEUTE1DRAFT_88327 [Neurospora tetrasperma FGSC 2508]EGO54730.1 hypothetical protein NEUTE1DRAFT_88327 [Neurospora tetrasperma FGSC 2508]EGZ67794.1 hypothetical protein NEUTE2DRAFT_117028 [Neurospora tetrasperma FGSC 2509]
MADVRALLRQQRAARRIEHPHAAYTDAGKLVCVLCREHIKTEALWDGHIRNTAHRQRLQALQQQQQQQTEAQDESTDQSHKRKFDFQDDDEATTPVSTDETDRASKRTRPNTLSPEPGPAPPTSNPAEVTKPPTLTRQQSFTPTAGIELAIPSRPATPADATTTPKSAGGPLRPFSQLSEQQKSQPSTSQSTFTTTSAPTPTSADAPQAPQAPAVDDDLWASFEADLLATPSNKPPAAAALTGGEAVISAAPVSAAQAAAAKSHDEEQSLRRAAKDMEIEDEREEATRALETEFEVMEELEARARRLRERREALRAGRKLGGAGQGAETGAGVGQGEGMIDTPMGGGDKDDVGEGVAKTKSAAAAAVLAALGKENAAGTTKGKVVVEEDEEDEDDEDDEDDWDGFRFRA